MNPIRSLLDFVSYPSHSRTMGILAFLIVVLAIPLTVNIAQRQQEIRQQAAGLTQCEQNGGTCDGNACGHLINKCLNDSYTDSVGTPPGCTGGRGASCNADNTAHNYSCYESLSFSCAAPAAETPAPPPPSTPTPPTPAPPSGPSSVTCPSFPGSGSCTYTGIPIKDQSLTNSNPCQGVCPTGMKTSTGATSFTGTSVKECQINNCFYDSYYDTNPAKAPVSQWCYDTSHQCQAPTLPPSSSPSTSPSPSPSTAPSFPNCNLESNPSSSACLPSVNTCNGTGTRQPNFDRLNGGNTSGTDCNHVVGSAVNCTVSPAVNNCSSGNTCQNGPGSSGVCVTPGAGGNPTVGNTQLAFSLGIDGIGNSGDQRSPSSSSGSNRNPKRPTRTFSVEILDANNNPITVTANGSSVSSVPTSLTYNSGNGKFEGNITINIATAGTYTVRTRADVSLKKKLGTIVSGQSGSFTGTLVNGDIAGTNRLIDSYSTLGGCVFRAAVGGCTASDLNDDGNVDQFDYNLYLREIAVVQNGE